MWPEFWLAFALVAALLLVPGTLLLLAIEARLPVALGSAPVISVLAYGVMGIVLDACGVPASTPLMVCPPVALALAVLGVRAARRRRLSGRSGDPAATRPNSRPAAHRRPGLVVRHELAVMGLYVLIGLIVTAVLFVANLGSPDAFIQAWDNVAHFDMVRSMEQSGVWSTLKVTYYPGASAAIDPIEGAAHYYPEGWHLLAVMLVDALGVPVTLATNAVNAAACAVVMPLGCYLMFRRVFGRTPRAAALGALVCLAFPSIPWNLMPRWTLYPNLLSLTMLPCVIAAFMGLAARRAAPRRRATSAAVFVLGCGGLVIAQPSSIFSAAVFLAPWCARRIGEWRRDRGSARRQVLLWQAAWWAFVALVWCALLFFPPLEEVVGYYWHPITSLQNAIDGVFGLSFGAGSPRYLLRLLVIVGVISALRTARLRWLVVPFAFCSVSFVVAGGIETPFKAILAGFWYTDPYRMAAMAALFCIPLAALGVFEVLACARRLLAARPRARRVAAPGLVVLLAAALYAPVLAWCAGAPQLSDRPDNFYELAREMAQKHDAANRLGYDAEKIAFVERALEITGTQAVVVNQPYDGSVYAYGVNGMNILWRYMSGYGAYDEKWTEKDESRILRTRLAAGLSGADAQAAAVLDELDAEYVLILDRNMEEMEAAFVPCVAADWAGFLTLDDDNPGVEVVLAEGDMRLYRITS